MTTDETKEFFKAMQRAFPADLFFEKIKSDAIGTIRMWSEILEDVQLECATRFLKNWSKNNTRVPAACDVYQFHKQELIDKRMRIESAQEEFIGSDENIMLITARKMYEQGLITNPFKKKAEEKKAEGKEE